MRTESTADAPARFTDSDHDRFTDWLRARSEPDWTAAATHRFTDRLGDGTLADSVFRRYLVQDYAFLGELVGLIGHAVGDAPTATARSRLVDFLAVLTDDEDDYFRRSFDALDVPASEWSVSDSTDHCDRTALVETTDTTDALIDLLNRAAREGGYAERLAVLVPAEWLYREWATRVAAEYGDGTRTATGAFYRDEWVELHATDGFCETVAWLREELDEYGPRLSRRRKERVEWLFCRTTALEHAFFEAAFE
jgi:thiaminase/transcriptional activator TenA